MARRLVMVKTQAEKLFLNGLARIQQQGWV
jgi:hypothetical protein